MSTAHSHPMRRSAYKEDRLEARVSAALKKFFQKAAALEGTTLTDFVVNSVHAAAKRVIQEHQMITLGERDREVFIKTLLNPPEPNPQLKRAFERYQQFRKSA
jgi:uncharacterized protein (DUF1778 family)